MRFTAAIERMTARGWHVQLYTTLPMISAIRDSCWLHRCGRVRPFRRPGRFARLEQPGFADLIALVKSGKPM